MNQRANSVADLAAVLLQAEIGPSEKSIHYKERSKKYWETMKKQKEQMGKEVPIRSPHLAPEAYGVNGVVIRWADAMDKAYAEKWPEKVKHHLLERHRYTAAFPAYEIIDQNSPLDPDASLEAPGSITEVRPTVS